MKKKILTICACVILVVLTATGVYRQGFDISDITLNNAEAIARGERGYACPSACLTYKAGGGGGLLCNCSRFLGRCDKWCD